jgi:hypothetical protein
MPAALEGIRHGTSWHDQIVALADRVRGSLPGPLGGSTDAADGGASIAASGSLRGGGAAGAGLLTKLAGLGAGGKVAVACLAGGAVATTCAATGVLGPLPVPGIDEQTKQAARPRASHARADASREASATSRIAPRGGPAIRAAEAQSAPPKPASTRDTTPAGDATATATATETETTATTERQAPSPLAPSKPPVQQQFGVPAASSASPAPAPTPTESSAASGSSGASAEQQEFGP